jgi:Rne/Rng family ribonuclease
MNKELYVSATPHETKVGIVEDDQLAEIYLERDNEYTLAGSIYKGRVTRVLPGMQSAFVDIGLERDAFLYVSDFMDLEQQDDDLDEAIPAGRAPESRPRSSGNPPAGEGETVGTEGSGGEVEKTSPAVAETLSTGDGVRESQEWRGRRRRRGRRGERGDRERNTPEPRFQRPVQTVRPGRDYDYGPPPGYQPIVLPGESISKYQHSTQALAAPVGTVAPETPTSVAVNFPEDEPIFAAEELAPHSGLHEKAAQTETGEELHKAETEVPFAAEMHSEPPAVETIVVPEIAHEAEISAAVHAPAGEIEEQEIEDDEAELASYGEQLEDDDFELVEETRAAGEQLTSDTREEASTNLAAEGGVSESVENGEEVPEAVLEQEERDAEELELEEAQEEAEALLEAEAIGEGAVDASAEVREPAPQAELLQRTQRAGRDFDRRRGRRGGRRFRRRENHVVPQISDLLKEGQEILVQIAKEPIGKKGARITSHIALPGRFLVYMPTVNHTGVSRKISSEEERQRLKRIIISERDNGGGGFIVRTAAAGASDDELRADIRFLKNLWAEIKNRSDESKSPALIYHDLNVVERVLRDQVTSDFSVIWVDSEQEYERILRFANRFQPALVRRVKLYTKETPLYEQFGLNEDINKALKSKVWLKSGGYIVINQTEALVAIDVNTGKYVGKTARLEDTIVKTNVDAIREIVRQVRLRDLGGIIVIDFIDMDERRNRQKVMQALEEALRADRAPSKVLQFNDFGLVAITRKRVKQSLERTIGTPCPYCEATGFVKSVGTICNEVYVEMRKISKHLEHSDVMLRVNPDVAKALKANNARLLNEMEELTKKSIIVKSDPALHQEQFDIH